MREVVVGGVFALSVDQVATYLITCLSLLISHLDTSLKNDSSSNVDIASHVIRSSIIAQSLPADLLRMSSGKIATFELSAKAHPYIPVSTTKILGNYTRDPPPEIPDAMLQERRLRLREHAETVEKLRKWAKHREKSMSSKIFRRIFLKRFSATMPPDHKLYESIDYFFPPRFDVLVTVCDFGDGRAERREVRLGDIERGKSKLQAEAEAKQLTVCRVSSKAFLVYCSVDVRKHSSLFHPAGTDKINRHAPLGIGLLHSVRNLSCRTFLHRK